MTEYPRYFEIDDKIIKLVLEEEEIVAYESFGKPYDGIARALADGRELTEKEYYQKIRENREPIPTVKKPIKSWEDLITQTEK